MNEASERIWTHTRQQEYTYTYIMESVGWYWGGGDMINRKSQFWRNDAESGDVYEQYTRLYIMNAL